MKEGIITTDTEGIKMIKDATNNSAHKFNYLVKRANSLKLPKVTQHETDNPEQIYIYKNKLS